MARESDNIQKDFAQRLFLEPIGYIATPFHSKSEAPHQPDSLAATEGIIQLQEGRNFEQALEDLEGMEKIWLIYWFDRNPNWKPKVLVPRGPRQKRGVFATRSPHRPNPIGLSLVDLISIDGLMLRVKNVDLLDGTPILDIKPYLPSVEAYPNVSAGWIDEIERKEGPEYIITYSDSAREQLQVLKLLGLELNPTIEKVLTRDPKPHPYKRIERREGKHILSIRAWRVYFTIVDETVHVESIGSGYDENSLRSHEKLSDDSAQRAFYAKFGL